MSTDIVPREKLTKQGVQGVVSVAGGIGAFILAGITASHLLGGIVGGLITVAGLALSGSKHEKGIGVVTTVVGVSTIAASLGLFGGLVHGVLIGAGVVLVGVGAYSLIRFFRGMKARS